MRLLFLASIICLSFAAPAAAAPPVVILTLDELPGAVLDRGDGKISSGRFPHLADIAKEATYYPYATTTADLTLRAIPSLVSGRYSEDGFVAEQETMYSLLRDDYRLRRVEDFAELPALCSFCYHPTNQFPSFAGVKIVGDDFQTVSLRKVLGSSLYIAGSDSRPALWHGHLLLPHVPYRFLPSGRRYDITALSNNPGISADKSVWYKDSNLPLLSRQRFLLQASFVDRVIAQLRRNLIKQNIWDETLFIVMADHGSSFTPGTYRRGIEDGNFAEIANVPLLVKYPGQRRGQVDRSSAQLTDIVATIADVTGRKISWSHDGQSLREPRPPRPVRVFGAYGSGWQEKPFADFIAERQRLVADWNRLFPKPRLWIGPNSELRGVKVSRVKTKPSSLTARPENLSLLEKPSGGPELPLLFSGTVKGLPAQAPLLVALNGRFVASGWSYRVGRSIRFTILLPEKALSDKSNRVELFYASPDLRRIAFQ